MPRKKNASKDSQVATRRSTRQAASQTKQEDDVPEVFQDMLIEAFHNNPQDFAPSPRPVKRRKVDNDNDEQPQSISQATAIRPPSPAPVPDPDTPASVAASERAPQVVFNNDFSDEDDSDVSFEDVDIPRDPIPVSGDESDRPATKSLQLDLSRPKPVQSKQSVRAKVKPLTKVERIHRLNVHKWHLLCLLLHLHTVNQWCDDQTVQKTLKPLVQRGLSNQLHLPETRTQAERKFSFDDALSKICHIWRLTFKITAQGMRKAQWRDHLDMESEVENAPDPVDFEDFQSAAKLCKGSRDMGAQLFCALLRSLAVDTRIVCSLQVLPFARTPITTTPQKPAPTYIRADAQDFGTGSTPSRPKKKRIVDSPYPIWWIEVFSPSISDWIPLDPLVRNTINKPRTGFEPAASDPLNSMSYVIAFEEDGAAKDITRRYTAYYNAKTRRTRVEITKGGSDWFNSVIQHFAKPTMDRTDRDEIEDAALNRRVIQEGMPKNVQDLKDHPVYVLERHLRNNEVIEPKRECGKFSVGTGKNTRLESVYRRENVHSCRSSEGWYRRGRDIRPGEQPLKRAVPRKKRATSPRLDDEDGEEEDDSVPLYAEFQTELYVPPPVVNGQVPRNGYGNLDVYVPSMIPAGGIHVRHILARQAAKALKIDAAEAVTGFVFKGRQGTAVLDGVVVDAQYTAAMLTTITSLEEQLDDESKNQRSAILSSVWKKMHAVLKVRQRIQDEYGEKAGIDMDAANNDDDDDDPSYDDGADGGGFMPDVHGEPTTESRAEEAENLKLLRERAPVVLPPLIIKQRPTVVRSPHKLPKTEVTLQRNETDDLFGDNEVDAGGFIPKYHEDGPDGSGGFMIEDQPNDDTRHGPLPTVADEEGGGFIPEPDDQSGGFMPEGDNGGGFLLEPDAAGGFLPDDEDNTGGGFFPEGETTSTNPRLEIPLDRPSRTSPTNHSSHPILPLNQADPTNTSKQPLPISTQDTVSTTASTSTRSRRKQKAKEPVLVLENDGSLSDNSLPSHDPEEDDMEMQWVEDAFED